MYLPEHDPFCAGEDQRPRGQREQETAEPPEKVPAAQGCLPQMPSCSRVGAERGLPVSSSRLLGNCRADH